MTVACEQCNGSGWIETADPDNPEICGVCLGTGIEQNVHRRMVELLTRESYSDGQVWRVISRETILQREMGIPCKPVWHEVYRRNKRVVCSCEAFLFGKGIPCKHIMFATWLSAFRVGENRYEVPSHLGIYIVTFEHSHSAVWKYRVHLKGTVYYTTSTMPDWMYRQANRYFSEKPAWIPQFPIEKYLDYDPFEDSAAAGA